MPLHHIVPKLILRRFAKNEKTLCVVSREDPSKTYGKSVKDAAAEGNFYNIPTEHIDPVAREGYDPEGVEAALSSIETHASPILKNIIEGEMPTREEDKFWLSFFVSVQLTRGWQFREMVSDTGNAIARQHFDPRSEELRENTKVYLQSIGEPHSPRDVVDFIQKVKEADWKIVPNKSHLILESLKQAWFPIGPTLLSRPLRVFRFDNPSLLTSDAAVGLWAPDSKDPRSVGVGNARGIFMSIDRYTALGFMSSGTDRDAVGSPFWASHINMSIADRATKAIYHHPDDNPLAGMVLLPRAKLVKRVESRKFLPDGRVKESGRHLWS